jgi:hypothetical protein
LSGPFSGLTKAEALERRSSKSGSMSQAILSAYAQRINGGNGSLPNINDFTNWRVSVRATGASIRAALRGRWDERRKIFTWQGHVCKILAVKYSKVHGDERIVLPDRMRET